MPLGFGGFHTSSKRPAQSNGSTSMAPQQAPGPYEPLAPSNFNPWTSSSGERPSRSSRWAQHSQTQNSSTPRFANSSATTGQGSKLSGMPAPINIPQRSRRTSYGGTAYLQQPPPSNPNAPSFASDTDTDSQEDFDYPESMFPMEAEPSRPGSRLSDSSRRTKADFADPSFPARKNPYGDFSSSIYDPVSTGSSAPARPRRQSFTSCNPAYNMDDMSSALPGEDPDSTARQSSLANPLNRGSGSASARRPSFGGGNTNTFAAGNSKRSSAPSTRAPATTFLTSPTPRHSSAASSPGPSKIVGFDMPQPSPVSTQEPPSFRQQQHNSPGVRIRPKNRASFFIAQEEEYDSASSVGSMTPRSGSLSQTYGY